MAFSAPSVTGEVRGCVRVSLCAKWDARPRSRFPFTLSDCYRSVVATHRYTFVVAWGLRTHAICATSSGVDELATAPDYDPLDAGDHHVVVVPDHVWSDLQARLDLEADILEAARLAHTRMAETLVVEAGASDYRRFPKSIARSLVLCRA